MFFFFFPRYYYFFSIICKKNTFQALSNSLRILRTTQTFYKWDRPIQVAWFYQKIIPNVLFFPFASFTATFIFSGTFSYVHSIDRFPVSVNSVCTRCITLNDSFILENYLSTTSSSHTQIYRLRSPYIHSRRFASNYRNVRYHLVRSTFEQRFFHERIDHRLSTLGNNEFVEIRMYAQQLIVFQ